MIALRVIREPSDGGATLGSLYLDDVWFCWTLEDTIRQPKLRTQPVDVAAWVATWKVPGETAIPAGRYDVKLTLSSRFKAVLPEVLDVPGFSGIRIHAGNTDKDTEGCLLLGTARRERAVLNSRVALGNLMMRLQAEQDRIFIDYENPPARHLQGAAFSPERTVTT